MKRNRPQEMTLSKWKAENCVFDYSATVAIYSSPSDQFTIEIRGST